MAWRTEMGGGGALHNMSAPPRTRIAVRPLRYGGEAGKGRDVASTQGADSGMALIATVSLVHLIRRYFPQYEDVSAIGKNPGWRDLRKLHGSAKRRDNLRLRCLVVLSRLALGELKRPSRQAVHRLADVPLEVLESTWLANVRRLRPEDHGLPAFGLVRPCPSARLVGIELESSLARALIIVSRSGGTLYSRGREPGLPDYTRPFLPFQLYGFASGGNLHD